MRALRPWLEQRILVAIASATSILWLFIEVAEEVLEGATHEIDTAILMAFRSAASPADPLGPKWFAEFVRDVSGLGSAGVLSLLVAATAIFLLLSGRYRTTLFVLAATVGGGLVSTLLKESFARPRPDLVAHGSYVNTASFPSGHAMMSAVIYLTLGAMIARLLPGRWLKFYVMSVATLLAGLIGVSRVYLGVHWPSDVLAGWAAGAAWALAWWAAAEAAHIGRGTAR